MISSVKIMNQHTFKKNLENRIFSKQIDKWEFEEVDGPDVLTVGAPVIFVPSVNNEVQILEWQRSD